MKYKKNLQNFVTFARLKVKFCNLRTQIRQLADMGPAVYLPGKIERCKWDISQNRSGGWGCGRWLWFVAAGASVFLWLWREHLKFLIQLLTSATTSIMWNGVLVALHFPVNPQEYTRPTQPLPLLMGTFNIPHFIFCFNLDLFFTWKRYFRLKTLSFCARKLSETELK